MDRYCFSYGSNMNVGQMKDRCPDAVLAGTGILHDYRFIINSRGVATIIPEHKGTVHGVVWKLNEEDEHNLDKFEGIKSGFYEKRTVEIEIRSDAKLQGFAYVATDVTPGKPRKGCLENILICVEEYGFPRAYFEELEGWRGTVA